MNLKNIKEVQYFARGKRGLIYTGFLNGKKVAIKIKNPQSKATERIKNEAFYLEKLNKCRIGPKFVSFEDNKLIYGFVEGDFIADFILKNNKTEIILIFKQILNQLFELDKLKIDKEEMHRPVKHIVITKKNQPVLIDFERAHKTEKPKNVTQFCQFLISSNLTKILNEKGIEINKNKIIELAKKYKHKTTKRNLDEILKELS